jgi:hypothetical protein
MPVRLLFRRGCGGASLTWIYRYGVDGLHARETTDQQRYSGCRSYSRCFSALSWLGPGHLDYLALCFNYRGRRDISAFTRVFNAPRPATTS